MKGLGDFAFSDEDNDEIQLVSLYLTQEQLSQPTKPEGESSKDIT